MLELINTELMYSGIMLILKGVSLEVGKGQIVALLGANGAGKTTTLKAISGLIQVEEGKVTDGKILFEKQSIADKDPSTLVKMGIVQVMEGRKIFEHLTVEQNLLLGAHLRSDSAGTKQGIDLIYTNYFPLLKSLRSKTAGYLSGGEQQMVVIGRAMMANPKLMLLDEPSLGLAPLIVKNIFGVVREINEKEHITLLIVEQNVKIALSVAQYGYIMEDGRIVLHDEADKLLENEDVAEFYLGMSAEGKRMSYKEVKYYKRRKRWLG